MPDPTTPQKTGPPSVRPPATALRIRELIHAVGVGPRNARHLTREEAAWVMTAILQREISEPQAAAIMQAMRIQSEDADELGGILDALEAAATPLPAQGEPEFVLAGPLAVGGKRLNMTLPTAAVLAGAGVHVTIVGEACEAQQIEPPGPDSLAFWTSRALALWTAQSIPAAPGRGGIRIGRQLQIIPGLGHAARWRRDLGIRTPINTAEKMVRYVRDAVQCVSYYHSPYLHAMRMALRARGRRGVLFRGYEGTVCIKPDKPVTLYPLPGDDSGLTIPAGGTGWAEAAPAPWAFPDAVAARAAMHASFARHDGGGLGAVPAATAVALLAGTGVCASLAEATARVSEALRSGAITRVWQALLVGIAVALAVPLVACIDPKPPAKQAELGTDAEVAVAAACEKLEACCAKVIVDWDAAIDPAASCDEALAQCEKSPLGASACCDEVYPSVAARCGP